MPVGPLDPINRPFIQSNISIIGGIITGSAKNFDALPVSGADAFNGTPNISVENFTALGHNINVLSASFGGASSSIIQALNYHEARIDAVSLDAAVSFADVRNALDEATGSVSFNDQNIADVDGLTAVALTASNTITVPEGKLILGSTAVGATATEINVLDGVTAGSAAASKALVLDGDSAIDGVGGFEADAITASVSVKMPEGGLVLGSTAVTSDAGEINLLDGSSAGTVANSKAVIYSSNGAVVANSLTASNGVVSGAIGEFHTKVSGTQGVFNDITLGGTAITSTGAEINFLDGSTAGTAVASKAVVLDSNKDIDGIRTANLTNLTASGDVQIDDVLQVAKDKITIGGVAVTTTAAEINFLDGATAGSGVASKALVLDSDLALDGVGGLEADAITASVSVKMPESGLVLGSTAVTSTATEINLLDGVAAGDSHAVVNSKAVIYSPTGTIVFSGTGADGNGGRFEMTVVGGLLQIKQVA